MGYTRKYFLERVKAVNELYSSLSQQGISNEYIYHNHIKNNYHISRSTFYEYLCIDYEKGLMDIEEKEQLQLNLFES
ncbi:MAG: hypothetical protein H6Q15_2092 [Bacteroidetes bacterium]|nr:hypothetical protein [Bacteroidota bacterium]